MSVKPRQTEIRWERDDVASVYEFCLFVRLWSYQTRGPMEQPVSKENANNVLTFGMDLDQHRY